jgi:hypothetical protein
VQDEEEPPVELEDHALAQPADPADAAAFGAGDRRRDGTDEEWAGHPHVLERVTRHTGREAVDVDEDVGQLRHGALSIIAAAGVW